MAEGRGVNIVRAADGSILFRRQVLDGSGLRIGSGMAYLRIFHVQPAGTFREFRFDANSFTVGSTLTQAMTHRTMTADAAFQSSATASGWWVHRLAVLTDFTVGDKYIAATYHSGAAVPNQDTLFQYGDFEGDQASILSAVQASAKRVLFTGHIFGTTLHVEVALERNGIVQPTPASAMLQIFSPSGLVVHSVTTGSFGAANARGYFTADIPGHALQAGLVYQVTATVDDGEMVTTTVPLRVLPTE